MVPTAFGGLPAGYPRWMPEGRVAVVVPAFRETLAPDERVSLRQLDAVLGDRYPRVLVTPRSLALTLDGYETMRFPDRFFGSTGAYSALLLSPRFYRAFGGCEYVLVHQLDALVFRDELEDWCDRGHDYVGAPWIDERWVERATGRRAATGNGGLSLRHVEGFLRVLRSRRYWQEPDAYWREHWAHRSAAVRTLNLPRRFAKRFRTFNGVRWETRRWVRGTNTSRTFGTNEDIFWSFEARRYDPGFRIADPDEALRFAFERRPRELYERLGALPFGCHAWARYDREFWADHLAVPSA